MHLRGEICLFILFFARRWRCAGATGDQMAMAVCAGGLVRRFSLLGNRACMLSLCGFVGCCDDFNSRCRFVQLPNIITIGTIVLGLVLVIVFLKARTRVCACICVNIPHFSRTRYRNRRIARRGSLFWLCSVFVTRLSPQHTTACWGLSRRCMMRR